VQDFLLVLFTINIFLWISSCPFSLLHLVTETFYFTKELVGFVFTFYSIFIQQYAFDISSPGTDLLPNILVAFTLLSLLFENNSLEKQLLCGYSNVLCNSKISYISYRYNWNNCSLSQQQKFSIDRQKFTCFWHCINFALVN
jgi:hypothetical protein